MAKIVNAVASMLISALLLMSPLFVRVNFAQQTNMYVDPLSQSIMVGTLFTVDIKVDYVTNLYGFDFVLVTDPTLIPMDVVVRVFLNPPILILGKLLGPGFVSFAVTSQPPAEPANGGGILATIIFQCTGPGTSELILADHHLYDPLSNPIPHGAKDGMVTQEYDLEWFIKPPYPDYAPAGMPDFDQKQDNWIHPLVGYTWCGPVSVANSLWWFDSKYESLLNNNPIPPPAISDSFGLVTAYGPWDDHDPQNLEPLVNQLAFLMDTDGRRTNSPATAHSGTFYKDMEVGLSQYLQLKGINPVGDCDGDGDVDYVDALILSDAFASVPGSPTWNMAADLNQDNTVSILDAIVLSNGFGKTGLFYEHTEEFPDMPWITEEVYACEDTVLLLELWRFTGTDWERWQYDPGGQGGHYVTVAGVDFATSQLLVSDPWQDAFEAGLVPGRSPFPHPYPHLPDLHNDTHFVSHDAYTVNPWMLPPSPYPGVQIWEFMGYPQTMGFDPSWHAFVRAAVVTSPIEVGLNATTSKSKCAPMPTVPQNYLTAINITVTNKALTSLTFDITAYANSTAVGTVTVTNMPPNSTIKVIINWNTTGFAFGDYFVSANASIPSNTFVVNKFVRVVIIGDIDGNGVVDVIDAIALAGSFGAVPSSGNWNPNADFDETNEIDVLDAILLAGNYGASQP